MLSAAICAALLIVPAISSGHAGDPNLPGETPDGPSRTRGDRYAPKPAGTIEKLKFWFGPYVLPAGWDANRPDLDLPLQNGYILSVEPSLRWAENNKEPSHQEGHIHHAHWFGLQPGNEEDNYLGNMTEWIFGNGDEETRADFQERTAADPDGPIYGQYIPAGNPQVMIYMLHNKTPQTRMAYIALDVTFLHGKRAEAEAALKREVHDVSGVLFGRTFNVPREPAGDGTFDTTSDSTSSGRGPRPIEWTSTVDGTIVGTGSHLHPGGTRVEVENLGSAANPCPDDGKGFGGTDLLTSEALTRNAPLSEDFQMEVTHPAWRAPIRKGDRIRITGVYENREHAWYSAMTHQGFYIDEAQPPRPGCKPYLVGDHQEMTTRWSHGKVHRHARWVRVRSRRTGRMTRVKRVWKHRHRRKVVKGIDVTAGVPNRDWGHHPDLFCGEKYGGAPCDRPESPRGKGEFTDMVSIANFQYLPGDLSLSGQAGNPPRVKRGKQITFFNADQMLNIRHSVTTCPWPCNGRYVGNYPLADGVWDSGTLGFDIIDGGEPNPLSKTPKDLATGKYAYFCRIHPWMRGAFEVVD